jgi:hypothetical protein
MFGPPRNLPYPRRVRDDDYLAGFAFSAEKGLNVAGASLL